MADIFTCQDAWDVRVPIFRSACASQQRHVEEELKRIVLPAEKKQHKSTLDLKWSLTLPTRVKNKVKTAEGDHVTRRRWRASRHRLMG